SSMLHNSSFDLQSHNLSFFDMNNNKNTNTNNNNNNNRNNNIHNNNTHNINSNNVNKNNLNNSYYLGNKAVAGSDQMMFSSYIQSINDLQQNPQLFSPFSVPSSSITSVPIPQFPKTSNANPNQQHQRQHQPFIKQSLSTQGRKIQKIWH